MVNSSANYWIAANALSISLNALGDANRIQCGLATGSVIMCYIRGVEGLEYDNGHNYRRWPLTVSPTYFETDTKKYIYVAIPRTAAGGTVAQVCFPSQKIDIYGYVVDENGAPTNEQIGNDNFYYIWLQGIISEVRNDEGTDKRYFDSLPESGTLSTDEAVNPEGGQWYEWNNITQTVTFLKEIIMGPNSIFANLKARIMTLAGHTLTGVAIDSTTDEDSTTDIATPAYIKSVSNDRYLRKDQDDATPFALGVGKDLDVGENLGVAGDATISGNAQINGVTRADHIQSKNYTGEGIADTGFLLTANDQTGSSKLVVDNLYVRKKATFEELEVKKETAIAGNQIFSSAANVINRTDYLDAQGNILGYSLTKVPWLVKQVPILLHYRIGKKMVGRFFGRLRKTRVVIDEADISKIVTIRCYFLAKDGEREVVNLWRGGGNDGHDLARCQTMNLDNSQRPIYISSVYESKAGNVYWWRKVVGVSSSPVKIDDQEYHYFDLSMTDCDAGSDIPAAGDHVVQFGNDTNPQRMNLLALEINGADAPAVKSYRGIYTYNLSKCWWGGSPRKMLLSPSSGYEFYGPSFKFVQEYGVKPESIDRGAWESIAATRDDYEPHANVRKCYYYDKVSHNGRYWLCVKSSLNDAAHWVDGDNNYITDAAYSALTPAQKALCSRKQDYTTAEPGTDAATWLLVVDKGDNMVRLDLSNEMDMVSADSTGKVRETRTVTTEVKVYDGASEVALNQANLTVGTLAYTDAEGVARTLSPTITASGTTALILSWTIQAGWTIAASNTISISYLYGGLTYQAVFSLAGSQGLAVFQLKPSMSAIPFSRNSANQLTPASQTVNLAIVKVDGASTSELTPATYGVAKIRYSFAEMPTLETAGTEWPSSGGVSVANDKENLYIALFNFYGVMIDRETIPVVVDGANGENSVRIDLDNENDTMLYSSSKGLVSGNVLSTASLFDGSVDKSNDTTWTITPSNCTLSSGNSRNIVVTAMSAETASVSVQGVYTDAHGNVHTKTAILSLKKILDTDKYELIITPNSIAYNSTTDTPAASTLAIQVWKTACDGTRALSAPPSGYNVYANGNALTASSTGTYSYTTDNSAIDSVAVKIATSASATDSLDAETIPVNKTANGVRGNFKSTVFVRQNTAPSTPTGGTYDSPVPSGWSDGVPDGDAIVWASACTFYGAGGSSGWSTPKQMTDTADFDVEFSSVASPNAPSGHPNTNTQWSNTSDSSTIWMATSECHNGVWSDWQVQKIKGEQGIPGNDGYTPQKGIDYFDGVNGKDGWMVAANPANVIINQNLDSQSSFTSATVGFTAKKGSTEATITSISSLSSSTFNVSASGNSVVVSSPKSSDGVYYSEGSFSVSVNVTDPDTGNTVSFNITVFCYANLLGTWKQTVEDGEEQIAANKIEFMVDNGVLVNKQEYNYSSTRSAALSANQWVSDNSSVVSGHTSSINTLNNTADRHEQTLNKQRLVDNAEMWEQGTTNETADAYYDDFKKDSSTRIRTKLILPLEGSLGYKFGSNYGSWQIFFIFYGSNKKTLYSDYALGWISPENDSWTAVTVPSGTKYVSLLLKKRNDANISPSDADDTDLSLDGYNSTGYINMTAENVSLGVKQEIEGKLYETGIDINGTNRSIKLQADKVTFVASDGTTGGKTSIDPTTGALNAVDGNFSGIIKASLFYGRTYMVQTNPFDIDLATNPYYTYYTESSASNHTVIRLPNPIIWDGVELRFFSPILGSSSGVSELVSSNGIRVVSTNGMMVEKTSVHLKPNRFATLKAMAMKWWVIDDGVNNPAP